MAQYVAVYRCGHSQIVNLYGKSAERDKKLDYLRTVDCPVCERKKQQQEQNEFLAKASANAIKQDLPILVGSKKQVTWAISIRQQMLDRLLSIKKKGTEQDYFFKRVGILGKAYHRMSQKTLVIKDATVLYARFQEFVDKQMERVKHETSATYFIDNRDYDGEDNPSAVDNSIKPCMIYVVAVLYGSPEEEVLKTLEKGGWI